MTFPNLDALFVPMAAPLKAAMVVFNERAIQTDGRGIALVVDEGRLKGVITDGDVRRALLAGHTLESPVTVAMTHKPVVASVAATPHQLLRLFDQRLKSVPIVDGDGRVVNLLLYSQFQVAPAQHVVTVRAKAPLRVSFAGGGSDFTRVFSTGGCAVISATIDRYCHGTLVKRLDRRIVLRSYDLHETVETDSIEGLTYDGHLDLLKAVIRLLNPRFGFELTTWCDAPPGSGLGASAVMTIVVGALINELSDSRLTEYQLSDLAYQAERIELGVIGGWQDQYAGAFGGLNYIEFSDQDVTVHPLALKERAISELEECLLLCFTGDTRNSGSVHRDNKSGVAVSAEVANLNRQHAMAAKKALIQGRLDEFGRLLDSVWKAKKAAGDVSNGRIDRLYEAALSAGAFGGKLLGAGRGGYLIFYCPPLKRMAVVEALQHQGGEPTTFNLDFRGLRVWHPSDGNHLSFPVPSIAHQTVKLP